MTHRRGPTYYVALAYIESWCDHPGKGESLIPMWVGWRESGSRQVLIKDGVFNLPEETEAFGAALQRVPERLRRELLAYRLRDKQGSA